MTDSSLQEQLLDRVALITGGASGIGEASAMLLAKHGARVCILDRNEERMDKVKTKIEQETGQGVLTAAVDVTRPEEVRHGIDDVVRNWGRLDIVFANAGINGVLTPIEELTPAEWDQTVNVNLKGTFLTVKYAVPHMKETGGSIIITSSINGSRTFSLFGGSAYSSSKAGQVAFAKMAALELSAYGIRVNVICPGAIGTNIGENTASRNIEPIRIPVEYPAGRRIPLTDKRGSPADVAELVLFLATDRSRHMTGTEMYIDGAESLL
jgi:NAD(P)-dependent dehydrogenase (short-subunit alcohol dehydrogenase family)